MATSINKSTNWGNAVKDVGYEVAANKNVNTHEQPSSTNKARKVAEALGQVGNSLGQFGQTASVIHAKQQSKAQEQITNLELLRASNMASEYEAAAKEFAETYDYSIVDGKRPSSEEVWGAFTAKHPEYVESLGKLTTSAAQNSLNKAIGKTLYTTYGTSKNAFERNEEDVELGNYAAKELSKVTLSAASPEFFEVFKNIDQTIQSTDRTPQESKALLMSTALRAANETGDFRLYSLLLGEVEGKKSILSNDEYDIAFKQRRAIKTQINKDNNQAAADTAAALKVNQVKLAQDTSALLVSEGATRETKQELVEKYLKLGVGNAYKVVNDMAKNFETIKEVEIDIEDETKLWQGFLQAGSPEDQMLYIQTKVKNGELTDKGLAAQFYSRVGNADDKALLSSVHVKAYDKWLTQLTQSMDDDFGMVDDAKYAYLKPLFVRRMLTLGMSPEWAEMDDNARWGAMKDLTLALEDLKASNDTNPNNDMQSLEQKRLMFKSARMKEEGANEAKRAEIAERTAELQMRIKALQAKAANEAEALK